MRSAIRALGFGALFSLGFYACSCGEEPPPNVADPTPVYTPETLAFGGLCAGELDRKELTIENKSVARLDVRFSFEGDAAASFRIEREGEVVTEITVPGNRSETLEIVYEPKAPAGEQTAWLIADTNSKKTPSTEILLTGLFSPNPVAPRFDAAWALCRDELLCHDGNDDDPCCVSPPALDHQGKVNFGKLGIEHEGQVVLALENRGCEPVTVTEATIEIRQREDRCRDGDLRVEIPEGGLELPRAVEVAAHDLPVIFKPSEACTLDARVTLRTTDPERPTIHFDAEGQGVAGSLQVISPTSVPVNFGDVKKGEYSEIHIILVNPGRDAVDVTEIDLGGNHAEHFELVRVEQCGAEVLDFPVTVASAFEAENECESRLMLVTRYVPKGPGKHGYSPDRARFLLKEAGGFDSYVGLLGRSEPKLVVFPTGYIAFSTPTETGCGPDYACADGCVNGIKPSCSGDGDCGADEKCLDSICTSDGHESTEAVCATSCASAQRTFRICNEKGANDLEIHALRIFPARAPGEEAEEGSPLDTDRDSDTYGEPIFTIDAGTCGAGGGFATLAPDACCEGRIQLLDNRLGGQAVAELQIETSAGEHRVLDVLKKTVAPAAPAVGTFTKPFDPRTHGPVMIRANVTPVNGGIGRYIWRMEDVPGANPLPEGIIDPADPDNVIDPIRPDERTRCAKEAGICYELLNDDMQPCNPDGSDCSVFVFHPTIQGEYHFSLAVEGTICGPPHSSGGRTDSLTVNLPGG